MIQELYFVFMIKIYFVRKEMDFKMFSYFCFWPWVGDRPVNH